MTRYDPFAYGNVRLDAKQPNSEADAEDMLFEGAESPNPPVPAPDESSWALRQEDVSDLLPPSALPPLDFDPEILGEDPGELDNVFSEHDSLSLRLLGELARYAAFDGGARHEVKIDAALQEKLRSLGYIK